MKYVPIIGLEVHIEQNTNSKMFCSCSADFFGSKPNTNTCPVCLGLPGALPFANQKAIENTIKLGLAFNCGIAEFSKFDRKHYFYPDLPKSYQISQYDLPLCAEGSFSRGSVQVARIRRIHLEEDTAKLQHTDIDGEKVSLVDFNRSGVPLIEMVTEPDFHDSESVSLFLKEVQQIVRYLGISTADMEKGSMRLEANISVAALASEDDEITLPDYKVELKNINSFKFLKKALEAEIRRQTEALSEGKKLIQETRGYDEVKGKTFSQRVKEEASDYRYFPEPDLPPLTIANNDVDAISRELPELPQDKAKRFSEQYGLSNEFVEVLTMDRQRADYYEEAVTLGSANSLSPKFIANAMVNLKLDEGLEAAAFIKKLYELTKVEYAPNDTVNGAITKVLSQNEDAVTKYHNGKVEIVGFLIGQVQKELKGKADPKSVNKLLLDYLQKGK